MIETKVKSPLAASDALWRYREAAAVLESFDRESLRPWGDVNVEPSLKTELIADCEVAYNAESQPRWSLRNNVRQAALRRLAETGRIKEALDANPQRARTVTQQLFEQFLLPEKPTTENTHLTGFDPALLKIVHWLDGVPLLKERLPSAEWVKGRLAREQLLEPFRLLVGTNFAGRKSELAALSDYVGWLASQSLSESITRGVEFVFNIQERPPLFISGPGGSGKSTLISKFILDHAEIPESLRFPFAYLDFDRPGLLAEEPVTLLVEIARQLSIQFPESGREYLTLADKWTERAGKEITLDRSTNAKAPAEQLRLKDRSQFLTEFTEYVNGLKSTEDPLLLVVDTFEEVQFRSATFAEEMFRFLNQLQANIPRLRTVLSGRLEFKSKTFPVRLVTIGNFDREASVSYLTAQGVGDPVVAGKIFEQVGGSPLVLRLASDVARIENVGQKGIAELRSSWLSLFSEKSIEVVLYQRILSHIVDPRVKELAYPGLVLRRITAETLMHVLSVACEVQIGSLDDAKTIVDTMRAQLSTILVPLPADQESLVHRPDMRWILLKDVTLKAGKDEKLAYKVNQIHVVGIEYYGRFDDVESRAEEIYHRLALGIDRMMLASRWMEGLTPHLAPSVRELPEPSQIYLAARLELELPRKLWDKADDADWMLYARRTALQCLEVNDPQAGWDVLAKRPHLWQESMLRDIAGRIMDSVFHSYADRYEGIRSRMPSGSQRTSEMNRLVGSLQEVAARSPVDPFYPQTLFEEGADGARLVALAVAMKVDNADHMELAIRGIADSRSPFEQFHALLLASAFFSRAGVEQRQRLHAALMEQRGVPIHETDPSRWNLRRDLLRSLGRPSKSK